MPNYLKQKQKQNIFPLLTMSIFISKLKIINLIALTASLKYINASFFFVLYTIEELV